MSSRRGHFCVLGASGFYGAQTVVALADLAARYARVTQAARGDGDAGGGAEGGNANEIVIVLAGRDPRKLGALLPDLQRQADEAAGPAARRRARLEVLPVPVDVASSSPSSPSSAEGDGGSNNSLCALALAAPVLLNCIRPVEYEWSERVMAACARGGAAYLDLCARPAFLDAVRELFSSPSPGGRGSEEEEEEQGGGEGGGAPPPPPPLVPGCGFDYALPDVATWYALRAYERRHSRPPTRMRATFLVRTPPPPPSSSSSHGKGGGGGGFKLRLGAVDELLAPPQQRAEDGRGHRGWDPRRADVRDALGRAAARRRALEAQGVASAPPRGRAWLVREARLAAGPRWTAPFFVGGGAEADLLRANLMTAAEGAAPPPPLEFDCRIALPQLPPARLLLVLALAWPLLLALACPLLAALVGGAALARRSPRGSATRAAFLALLPYLTLGLVTSDDALARRSADRSVFERVCVLSGEGGESGEGEGGGGGGARPLRVAFRGSFAQSLTPQCVAAAAVCLHNDMEHAAALPQPPPPQQQQRRRRPRVLTPAQALVMAPPPPGCASFLDMLCARHGLVIEEEEL